MWRNKAGEYDTTAIRGPPDGGQIGDGVYEQGMGATDGIPGDRSKSTGPSFIAKKSNYPIDCVIVYKSDIITNSYEISVCLESDFFMNKKKWDGGNDDHRYEIGNDLRLNTEIIVQENGKITSSENSSIFK